jgi:putative Mg2+ transporter-C (MgtC) family protein
VFDIGDIGFQLGVLLEVIVAMVLGGLIGAERELAGKSAGLRTHMMMAGSAALLVALGDVLSQRFMHSPPGQLIQADPIRIVEAVITGVSFLGAGMIFRRTDKNQVDGLTTATGVLLTSGVGICVALSQIVLAVGVTIATMVILRGLVWLELRITARAKLPQERESSPNDRSTHTSPAE